MFGDISRYKIQALLPPDGPEPDEMPVIHGRIFPSFGRPTMISGKLEDSLEDTAVHDIQNEPAQISSRTHAVDFMALLQEKHGAQDITTRTAPMRVIIENNMNRPFPQSHKISLTMPTQDIFFHWDFECSHFSFKSLMSRMNWIADNELDFQVKLSNFGQSVRKCLQNCASDPDRSSCLI